MEDKQAIAILRAIDEATMVISASILLASNPTWVSDKSGQTELVSQACMDAILVCGGMQGIIAAERGRGTA